MSNDVDKMKKGLKIFQELKNLDNPSLTDFQKQTINNFVNFAEFYELIEPFLKEGEDFKPSFTPDIGLKQVIGNISHSIILKMFNDRVKSNFKLSREIKFGFTEYFDVTGDPDKMFIRGDIKANVEGEDAPNNTVLVELQAVHKTNVAFQMHSYGNNNMKRVLCKVKKIVDGKVELVEEYVYIRPYELVIYTSTKFKQKEGYLRFNTSSNNYEANGEFQSIENGDVITHLIPFVNIFQMTLEELNDSSLSFLQCVYLYKFKQDKSLIKDKVVIETAKAIEHNLRESLSEEDFELVMKPFTNTVNDLCNELNNEPQKYEKEIEYMNSMATTYVGQIELKARKEGIKEGIRETEERARKEAYKKEVKMVLNMINENLSDETISICSELPIEEIAKIREEHLN